MTLKSEGGSPDSGNVLFLILIAVALFAALSYAVTRSTNAGGKSIRDDEIKIGAAQITQYVTLLKTEVQRLLMTRGCRVENLDWRNDAWMRLDGNPSVGILHNPQIPKSGCAVFSSHGGPVPENVNFEKMADKTYNETSPTWRVKGGHATTNWINRKNEGTAANDIGILIYGLDHKVCAYLLDPVRKPTGIIEAYADQADPNTADPAPWTTDGELIDEPDNLAGSFFANFNSLATGPGCVVGTVIVAR